ncbi:MAG TPA: FAD-dependent oxidoreductase, partial [Thermoanaerobaculia bacterium]|nr:FAD-dependent oxidoreductase [Thermoanaerobaculia bacterium]
DKIVDGFTRQVGTRIRYGMRVDGVKLSDKGVEISVTDVNAGKAFSFTADYCVSNMPLPLLAQLRTNFSADFDWAVKRAKFDPTCKVGWQANRRFWEDNKYQIYGGISYIDAPITQMWYPSEGYFGRNGTLTGAYNYEEAAARFGKLSPQQRLIEAKLQGSKLHPEIADNSIVPLDRGLSIAWQNIPYQRGGWANWNANSPEDAKAYARLLAPDGRFHVVGDQVSPVPGWQEGAMMSAEHVVEQIAGLRPTAVPDIERAPHTRRMILGTRH